MARSLGVAIHRHSSCLVGVETAGKGSTLRFERVEPREPGTPAPEALVRLLRQVPPEFHHSSLAVAVSSADLACADAWPLPPGIRESSLRKTGPTLVESRCLGEPLESLALDLAIDQGVVQSVAIERESLARLREAVRGFTLALLTGIPCVLAREAGSCAITVGGERIECRHESSGVSWRSYPVEAADDPGPFECRGHRVPVSHAAALAAALATADSLPNFLAADGESRLGWIRKLRDPLLNVAAALLLCLTAGGIHFHRELTRERIQRESVRQAERALWHKYLPGEDPAEGRFLRAVQDRLALVGEGPGGERPPSALAFWEAIGKQFPDPEALGLTLESLDLAPDGGRMSARVTAAKDDPLKNASALERDLNRDRTLSARGDYEVKDGEVHVRLRMDFKP
jgi:hypothetical protein